MSSQTAQPVVGLIGVGLMGHGIAKNIVAKGQSLSFLKRRSAPDAGADLIFTEALADADELQEERRLAYVGITRARRYCTISFAANRRVYNQWQSALPSRFIDELPPAHVEVLTPPGLYGGGYGAAAPAPASSASVAAPGPATRDSTSTWPGATSRLRRCTWYPRWVSSGTRNHLGCSLWVGPSTSFAI